MEKNKNKSTPNAKNNDELEFPFLFYPPSPPHYQRLQNLPQPQQQQNSQFYNIMSPDYNSIFPVFPLMVEQSNPFQEFFDGFLPDLSSSLAEEVGVGLGLMENLPIFVQQQSPPRQELQCEGPSVTKSVRGKRKRSCRLSTRFGSFMDPNGKSPTGPEPTWLSAAETGDLVTHPMDDSIVGFSLSPLIPSPVPPLLLWPSFYYQVSNGFPWLFFPCRAS